MGRKRTRRSSNTKRSVHPYSVFVSHATHDKWIATILCEKIETLGATAFRDDRDIKGGDLIPDTILSAIRESDELVVLLTPESVSRQWVVFEIGIATGVDRRIVPLIYHIDADQIPGMIRQIKALSLNELDQYLSELRERMANR